MRNIVLLIIVAVTSFEHLTRVIRISEPKNNVYIRNIYILYNIPQPLPSYFNKTWFCVLRCHCGVTLFGLFK